jgi:alkanesulfonate monooxygenase SsuD/methylene tetrahydromethanopterin reductase-like flavin-dependent oxidoreductase (luciferase family)
VDARVPAGHPVSTPVRLGVLVLPEHSGTGVWERVEQLGVRHAWTYDHLHWQPASGGPWFDALTTLAGAACVTRRIALGTLVASPSFRHPLTTASQVMTLDHLSGGRFILGVGSGAPGPDITALGGRTRSPADLAERLTEFITLADTALRGQPVDFAGQHYTATGVRLRPGCVQQPRVPFAVAATGPRGMRLAARYSQYWVTIGRPDDPGGQPEAAAFATLRAQLARLGEACRDAGRDPADLRKVVQLSRVVADPYRSPERLRDLVGRSADLGFTDVVVAYPRRTGIFAGDPGSFERAVLACTEAG